MRSAECPDPGGGGPMWASAPTRRNHRTSRKSGAGPGGHTGRPYEETGGGAVGAACVAARAHRRVGCTVAERTPLGIDNKSTIAERTRCGGASGDGAKYPGPVVHAPLRTGSKQAGQPLFADGDV